MFLPRDTKRELGHDPGRYWCALLRIARLVGQTRDDNPRMFSVRPGLIAIAGSVLIGPLLNGCSSSSAGEPVTDQVTAPSRVEQLSVRLAAENIIHQPGSVAA